MLEPGETKSPRTLRASGQEYTHTRLIFAALFAAVSVGASIGSKRTEADGGTDGVRVVFALEGPPIDGTTPGGRVVYESNRRGSRLRVVARNVDLPKGTTLVVRVDGLRAGLIHLGRRGNSALALRTKDGEYVPRVGIDSMVEVREHFSHRLVLSNETPGGTASHALWVVPRMPVTLLSAVGRRAA